MMADRDAARLWPHAAAQDEQASVMLRRLTGWRDLVHGVGSYLEQLAALDVSYGKAHSDLANVINVGAPSYGQLSQSLGALRDYSTKLAHKHVNMGFVLMSNCGKLMVQLRRCIDEDVRGITDEITRHQTALRTARLDTMVALRLFEKAYWSSESTKDLSSGDPWLAQETLNAKLQRLANQERIFNDSMAGFYAELAKIDAYLMENMQVVLANFSKMQSTVDAEIKAAHDSIGTFSEQIQPQAEFERFADDARLNSPEAWQHVSQPIDYRYREGPLTRSVKAGFLQRRVGTVMMSWRETWVVITACGFLHCFDQDRFDLSNVDIHPPAVSINLRRATLDAQQMPAPLQFSFEIIMPPTSRYAAMLGSPRLGLMASSYLEMLDWINVIRVKSEREQHWIDADEAEAGAGGALAERPAGAASDVLREDDFVLITAPLPASGHPAGAAAPPPSVTSNDRLSALVLGAPSISNGFANDDDHVDGRPHGAPPDPPHTNGDGSDDSDLNA